MKWGYATALISIALIVGSCSEETRHPLAPESSPSVPLFAAGTPFNNNGACLAKDAWLSGGTNGVNDSLDLADPESNCTANDINIATAEIVSFSTDGPGGPFTTYTGQSITCNQGDTIWADMRAILDETATSERTDIGVWIATDGGNARTGTCNHYNLVNGVGDLVSVDGDQCGDMNNAVDVTVPLGVLALACTPAGALNDSLHIGACLGWTQPGGDQVCPTSAAGPNGFRFGTVPGTTSKCNCDGFNIPIIVNKTATIRVDKVCQPASIPGATFDLNIDGSPAGTGNDAACGGTTGVVEVSAGNSQSPGANHTVTESGFTTADYNSSFVCTVNGHALSSSSGTDAGTISALPDSAYVCTFTNQKKPRIRVVKATVPTTDPGKFDFTIGGTGFDNSTAGYGNGQGTAFQQMAVGAVAISEAGHTGTALGDYTSTLACVDQSAASKAVTSNTGTSGSVNLAAGEDITCTFTNTRDPGKIELKKALSPTNDPGLFNLFVKDGGTTVASASDVGHNGTTGAGGTSLAAGTYNLSETQGTATLLTNYTVTGPSCVNRVGGGAVTVTSGNVDLVSDADIVCTITNTRNTGKIELVKSLSPTSDPGLFNLFVKSGATTVASAANVGHNGTTGAGGTTLNTGTYNLSETAGNSTVLTDYTVTGPACVNRVGGGSVTVTAGNVDLANNADIVCTITNTRNTGKIELVKSLAPTDDAGLFNLFVKAGSAAGATVASAANVGHNGTTGAGGTTLNTGTYNLSETAGTATVLGEYTVTGPSCVNRVGGGSVTVTSGNVSLANNADIVCTITNTRKARLIITKTITGALSIAALFDFSRVLGTNFSAVTTATLGNGGSDNSGFTLIPGTYTVCELNVPVALTVSVTVDAISVSATETNPSASTTNLCVQVILGAGQTKTVAYTNSLIVGTGGTRTIGYWKNWSSCTGGNQYIKATQQGILNLTLDGNIGAGSSIYPLGLITSLTCQQAVNLLSKNAINGTNRSGDPIYNMVAQLLGAKLNQNSGSGQCAAINDPVTGALKVAQDLLIAVGFNGLNNYNKKTGLTAAQVTSAQTLNGILTSYNEGTLGGGCPTHV